MCGARVVSPIDATQENKSMHTHVLPLSLFRIRPYLPLFLLLLLLLQLPIRRVLRFALFSFLFCDTTEIAARLSRSVEYICI